METRFPMPDEPATSSPVDSIDPTDGNAGAEPRPDAAAPDSVPDPAIATGEALPAAAAPSMVQATETPKPPAEDAMRLLSRMQTDLAVLTENKRPATYVEVDHAFQHAVRALGLKRPVLAGDARHASVPISGQRPIGPEYDAGAGAIARASEAGGPVVRLASVDPLPGAPATPAGSLPDATAAGARSAPGLSTDLSRFEHLDQYMQLAAGGVSPDGVSAQAKKAPVAAGAAPAGPSTGKKKGAKTGATAAAFWPALPDQRPVTLTRDWPIPGDHHFAVDKAKGTNKRTFSDGRYAPNGGYRGLDEHGKPKKHKGIDLPATTGDPVGAAADGVVLRAAWQKDWGNFVAIRHPDGYVTLYAHLDKPVKLKEGQAVTRGMEIGKVGNSGNARTKGTHLHFEVRVFNGDRTLAAASRTVDPEAWLKGELHEP
jgi:murein DD-endopeptidase MepM/ murein hydrolase activator NlpD